MYGVQYRQTDVGSDVVSIKNDEFHLVEKVINEMNFERCCIISGIFQRIWSKDSRLCL